MSAARTFVIGDIHGCSDELCRLLDALTPGADDTLCFLGDYVDRGPAPRAVIDRLLRLRAEGPRCVFLKGNHEDMLLGFLGHPGRYGEAFLWNGGGATLASYGLSGLPGPVAEQRLPEDHRAFLLALDSSATFGRYLCVHAGVRPTRALDDQSEEDLLWIRDEFTTVPHPFPYTVLYGHTPYRDVHVQVPYHVGLDTGLVYGNRLSCLELGSAELWQITRHAHDVQRRDLAPLLHSPAAP
jgi:serine/threonine protein phosphatase 1